LSKNVKKKIGKGRKKVLSNCYIVQSAVTYNIILKLSLQGNKQIKQQ